jgi:PhnB protein
VTRPNSVSVRHDVQDWRDTERHDVLMIHSAVPRLVVGDPDEAIEFYRRSLGARLAERFVLDDVVVHAQLNIGAAAFTLTAEVRAWGLLAPSSVGGSSSLVTLEVVDARSVGEAMVSAGATVVVPIEDRPYGRCEGRIQDPFGHLWIPTHRVDRSTVPLVRRIVPDLTTTDLAGCTEFYRDVLGLDVAMDTDWVVTLAAPNRRVSQLTLISRDATAPVDAEVSVEVDDLDVVWNRVMERGTEIVHPRQVEAWGVERFFFRDPAGHVVNVLCHRSADD